MSPFYGLTHRYDLGCFRQRFYYFHSPAFFYNYPATETFMYPPLMAVLYKFFYFFHFQNRWFYGLTEAAICLMMALLARNLRHRGLFAYRIGLLLGCTLLLSYPLYFENYLGNMEICVFIILAAGVWAFFYSRGYTAAACFGVAGALKIFPLVYVGLLLARKQYRQTIFALAVAAASTVAAFWLVCPVMSTSVRGIQSGLGEFRIRYMLQFRFENRFDHSIYALIKALFPAVRQSTLAPHALSVYLLVAASLGTVLYFWKIRNLAVYNQVLALSVASVVLPPTSHDYTLLHMYIPWALLVICALDSEKRRVRISGLMSAFVCFAILFAPETEFIVYGRSYGGQIKALTLIALFLLALRHRFPSSFDEASEV